MKTNAQIAHLVFINTQANSKKQKSLIPPPTVKNKINDFLY